MGSLRCRKALWWVGVQLNFTCWPVSSAKGLAILAEFFDEFSVVTYLTEEGMNLFGCFGWLHVLDGLGLQG